MENTEPDSANLEEELIAARMLAAEREHEIVTLTKRLKTYTEIAPLEEEEDQATTELWLSGNEFIAEGEIGEGVSAYTSSMTSLLRRHQELKQRVAANRYVKYS
jgi:uncharacterized protein YcbX